MTSEKAWVTLATNDTYSLGALVLAHSLKKVKTSFKLVVMITTNVSNAMRGLLQSVYDEVKEVNILDSGDADNLRLLARPELGVTFTKLHCWRLTQYEKCVFLDADTLVLQNCDDLFEREELSAAPDVGWPDCFNSGVFVFKPSQETYQTLISFALSHGSFDGGDQGLLNMFFSYWATGDSSKRLPFLYNLSSTAIYSYLPAFKWYGKGVKIVHFIAGSKPWLQPFNSVTRLVQTDPSISHLNNFLQYWWDIFCHLIHPQLSPEMSGLAYSLSQMKIEEPTPEQLAQEDLQRRLNWEQGNIDFLGRDSFDNIWNKITESMLQTESQSESAIDEAFRPPASATVTPLSALAAPAASESLSLASPLPQPAQETPTTPAEVPTSQTQIELPAAAQQQEATKSSRSAESDQSHLKVSTEAEEEAEPPVSLSSILQSQTESAPVCVKPSPDVTRESQPEKEPSSLTEGIIPPPVTPKAEIKISAESTSITPTLPKSPELSTTDAASLVKPDSAVTDSKPPAAAASIPAEPTHHSLKNETEATKAEHTSDIAESSVSPTQDDKNMKVPKKSGDSKKK